MPPKHMETRASLLRKSANLAKKNKLDDKERESNEKKAHVIQSSKQRRSKDAPGERSATKATGLPSTDKHGAKNTNAHTGKDTGHHQGKYYQYLPNHIQKMDVSKIPHQGGSGSNTPGPSVTAPKSSARLTDNIQFYSNKLRSKPSGSTIEEMLRWRGDYRRLESNHSYIQWLFPIPEGGGVNRHAQSLQEHEAQVISSNDAMRTRVLEAYQMMLDFYGMELARDDGSVRRCNTNWKDRYAHLNRSRHNYLRITRIIKSLGCLGYEHFQLPWVEFLVEEAFDGELPGVRPSVFYWVDALNDVSEQEKICIVLARCGVYGPVMGLPYDLDSEGDSSEGEYVSETVDGATAREPEVHEETIEQSTKGMKALNKSQHKAGEIAAQAGEIAEPEYDTSWIEQAGINTVKDTPV